MSKDGIYSQRLRAGKRRTYFFDVRTTKSDDYYITITESKKRFDDDGYDRHKIFIYKEDFNKFLAALENTVNHVKDELLPEYNFDEFDRDPEEFVDGEWVDSDEETAGNEAVTSDSNLSDISIDDELTFWFRFLENRF